VKCTADWRVRWTNGKADIEEPDEQGPYRSGRVRRTARQEAAAQGSQEQQGPVAPTFSPTAANAAVELERLPERVQQPARSLLAVVRGSGGWRPGRTLGGPREEELALAGVLGECRGALELGTGLVAAAELGEEVAAHAGQEEVALE
jgi:hypothetical protein